MEKLLSVKDIDKSFYCSKSGKAVHAVNQVSFSLHRGEFLGLVGESGCGKSTIAKMVMGMTKPDDGTISICGNIVQYPYHRSVYKDIQMVFQMPKDSFDPRRKMGNCITEAQRNFGKTKKEAAKNTDRLLEMVGLNANFLKKYPHEMSGGECQRAAIARALSVEPKIMICDEITSSLDVSIQAQVIELLCQLRQSMDLSILFISHDLALVGGICDRVLVMNQGEIVESGKSGQVLLHPQKHYTKQLISSVLEVM